MLGLRSRVILAGRAVGLPNPMGEDKSPDLVELAPLNVAAGAGEAVDAVADLTFFSFLSVHTAPFVLTFPPAFAPAAEVTAGDDGTVCT